MSRARGPRGAGRLVAPWISGYDPRWLRADVVGGVTLAVMLIPQAMAYAALAGLPPITGLYAGTVALLAYALLGTSSHLSFGPVALVSLLTAAAIEPLAGGDPSRAVALAGVLALLVGGMHLLLGVLRAGAVVNLLSHPVVIGFTAAAGLIIALTQVRDVLGVDAPRSERVGDALRANWEALPETHLPTATVAALALLLLLLGKKYAPRVPTALLVSVAAIVAAVVLDLESAGVAVVGTVPAGLPRPAVPTVAWTEVRALLGPAAVIALIAYAESISIAKAVAARSRDRLGPNRELLASGAANLAVGATGGYPVAGSFTRTAVVHDAGGRTQLAGVVAAAALLLTLALLTGLLEPLPRAVLAAIVIMAVTSLVDVRGAISTFRVDRLDGLVLLTTFVATLALGVELGLLVGVSLNVGGHVARGMRPAMTQLGRVEGTTAYRNVERYATVTVPEGVVLRLDGPLNFLSVEEVTGRLRSLAAEREELRWLVLDASGVTGMDSTGVHALRRVQQDLAAAGVELHLATVRGPQRDVISRAGLWADLIEYHCHASVTDALAAVGLDERSPLRAPHPTETPPDELL
jgi:sulfate permease, SulP family